MTADICITRVIHSYSHSLAEMERSRVTALSYVLLLFSQTIIYGEEIEMKVRPGDNITLPCDRALINGTHIVWIKNCFDPNHTSLIINHKLMFSKTFPHLSLLQNSNNKSIDLHISNITVFDLGLYYCAEVKRGLNGQSIVSDVYYRGNQTTRLSLGVTSCFGLSSSTVFPPPPVSDCFLCWMLLVSVCVVCFLLCFICIYCLYQRKTTDAGTDHKEKIKTSNSFEGNDDDVCYASLDVTNRRQKRPKKKQQQSSDFSIYAPVRTDTVQN